jgi:lysophospholipid acyltransferase (LPLAT)-like uncharacterized protein
MEPSAHHPPPKRRHSGIVVPHRASLGQRLVARCIQGLALALATTLRFRWENLETSQALMAKGPVIFCLWHNRLALAMVLLNRFRRGAGPNFRLAAMVSASRDGGLLAHILELFNVVPVRGSSSRRGPQALLEMTTHLGNGVSAAITPDGPRGPCYHVHQGVVALAIVAQVPVIPLSYHLNWKFRLGSWDRLQVPLPFCVCTVTFGEAFRLPKEADEPTRAHWRKELEQRLRAITRD